MNSIIRSSFGNNLKRFIQTRSMGGGQPVSQSMEARLWQGHSTKPEGWETTIYATYGATAVLVTLALAFSPDTTITTWASDEARKRLDLQAEGKLDTPEFGVHYSVVDDKFQAEWEKFMVKAMNPEEDDDDDDDDDEDDDEEGEGEEEEEDGIENGDEEEEDDEEDD